MKNILQYVVCLWEYVPPATKKDRPNWKLMDSCPFDDWDQALIKGHDDPEDMMQKWMFKGKDCFNPNYRMGRAVTVWNTYNGVRLMHFHPPEWCEWLGVSFEEKIRDFPDWPQLIEGGATLKIDTIREAQKYFGVDFAKGKGE